MAMITTAGSAQVGFDRIAGCGSRPSHGSRPTTGSIRVPKTTAATATELTTVEEKMTWKMAIPLSARWAARASIRPPSRPVGTTISTNSSVEIRLWWKAVDDSTSPTWLRPTKVEGSPGYGGFW